MVITVCVGSSCHVRGAHDIINRYLQLIREHGLQEQVQLKGSFCMDRCRDGVNLQIDGEPLSARSLEDAERIFRERVLARPVPPPGAGGESHAGG